MHSGSRPRARRALSPVLGLALLLALPAVAVAAWLPEGSPVCTSAGDQGNLVAVPDGASGLYLVWLGPPLQAQHLDDQGEPLWAVDGVPVSTSVHGAQQDHHICTDGDGELWVAWNEGEAVYLEHLDASGQPSFHGSTPYLLSSDGRSPVCARDGAGGVMVAWRGTFPVPPMWNYPIHAARVGPGGDLDPAGSPVVGMVASELCPLSIAANEDPGEGIFLGWADCEGVMGGPSLVQWVGTDLLPRWNGSAGIELPNSPDGWIRLADRQQAGGGVYALVDRVASAGSYDGLDVFAVTEDGTVVSRGIDTIDSSERSYVSAQVRDNGHGGFFCTWGVRFSPCECLEGIYAANFDYDGSLVWGPAELPGTAYRSIDGLDTAVLSDRDRLFVSWSDSGRLEYASLDWATGAASASLPVPGGGAATRPALVASSLAGTGADMRPLIAWLDERAGEVDIYANNLDADWPDTNVLGLYTAGDGSGVDFRWCADGLQTLYLCLTDYRETGDLAAWECRLDLPPNAAHVATVLRGGGTNLAVAPSYVVDLAWPLPPAEVMVLAEITLLVTSRDSSVVYLQPVAAPCLPGRMSLAVAEDPGGCRPLEWASGAADEPVFHLNSSPSTDVAGTAPVRHRLLANRPNPFNPRTVIPYELSRDAPVDLRVYDVAGRLVRALKEGVTEAAGRHTVVWDGLDVRGRPVPAGVYICRLRAGASALSRRLVLVR